MEEAIEEQLLSSSFSCQGKKLSLQMCFCSKFHGATWIIALVKLSVQFSRPLSASKNMLGFE